MKLRISKNLIKSWKILLFGLLLLGAIFYWFQYRPYNARRDCAWKRMHTDEVPYKPAFVPTEVQTDACIQKCQKTGSGTLSPYPGCESRCYGTPEKEAEPEKTWWAQTTEKEYDICLRGKGF